MFNDGSDQTQGMTSSGMSAPDNIVPGCSSDAGMAQEINLDLRHSGTLPADLLRRLNAIMVRDFSAFNQLIASLSRGRERNIDWWVCRPATRNNHVSHLYAQCMQIKLIRELLDEGLRVVVRVDSPEMAATLRQVALETLTVIFTGGWKTRLRRVTKATLNIASSCFHCLASALAAWITRGNEDAINALPLTLINTFVSRSGIVNGEFDDRYYPGLFESLSELERQTIRYVPVFYKIRKYISTFRALREGRARFLFYEDYLGLRDYAFAFGHWWRSRRLSGVKASYAGFEVGPLVDADITGGRFASIVVRALLAYRFHIGSSQRKLRIKRVLDWYEGLDFNHAIAASINWHCPQTELIGFRSAGSLYYISCTPAPHEVRSDVLPRELAVVGTGLAKDIQALCPALHILPAPGLRYLGLSTLQRQPAATDFVLLLALPLSLKLSSDAIVILAEARRQLPNFVHRWLVKNHPALPQSEILAALGGLLPAGFEFVHGDFYTWLARVNLVAGVDSSALMESVALGVPTICLATGNAPTEMPVPSWVDRSLSRVAYNSLEAAEAIKEMLSEASPPVDRARLHEMMLGVPDVRMMRDLIGLHDTE
jgi:hypothetical protein